MASQAPPQGDAVLRWQLMGQYLSALCQCGGIWEAAGCVDDASEKLRLCFKLVSTGCVAVSRHYCPSGQLCMVALLAALVLCTLPTLLM